MTAPLAIRPLEAADHAAWLPLWQGYQRFYQTEIAAQTSRLTFQRLLDPAEPMGAILAWRGTQAVGLAHYIFHRSCWSAGDYCYLQDLYVAEGDRGGGVGRALIERTTAIARARGCSRIHWLTHQTNTEAMQLYDRISQRSGFVQYRTLFA